MDSSTYFPPLAHGSPVFTVLGVAVVFLIIIFGLVGNFGICAMVYTHRHLQTIPNYLIVNLSVSDLLRIFSLSLSLRVFLLKGDGFLATRFVM